MTSGNSEQQSSLDKAREWLDRTAGWLEERLAKASSVPQVESLRVAALIGQGYAQLAQAEAAQPVKFEQRFEAGPELAVFRRRAGQAAEEARPHDDEPMSLHTALAVGIDRGLRDLGAELSGCTPSMLTGHVIRELRDAGLHPSEADRG